MSNDFHKGVIIIGGHVQALGITRILGKLGMPIVIVDSSSINMARHSKYCGGFVKFGDRPLLDVLLKMGASGDYDDYIIFPTNDLHVGILSENKKELSQYFIIGADDWDSVEKCYNKRLTYNIALKLGIPIANTWMPDSLDEIKNLEPDFPCIVKPAVMHSFYSKLKTKVFLCNNKEELIQNYKKAITVIPANEVIIQAVIKSESDGLYSACFLYNKDHAIQSFVGRRARQHPPDFGNATTFAQIIENDEIENLAIKILNEIGYTGLCEVEFMYDKNDNEYKFLEINPRTWKWHSIANTANVNILESYVQLLSNKPLSTKKKADFASFRHLITDIPTLIKYKQKKLFKKYPKYPMQYAVWDLKDLKPFIFELIYLPITIFKR